MKNLQLLPLDEEPEKARLIKPAGSGYVLLAAEVDAHPPFLWPSRTKRHLIEDCVRWCKSVAQQAGVLEAVTFQAILFPPIGEPGFLRRRRDQYHRARFDLVLLVETDSVERAETLFASGSFRALESHVRSEAGHVYVVAASNARRIGAVDHRRGGVFLFNYFYADSLAQNLAVWEYTAGWFQKETGLDNSTVLAPTQPDLSQYTLINHSRWDKLTDVLPSLVFKRSFRDFVLAHFDANDTAPMPILYKLAN
ncbi:MAG TPA: hypothetical protein VGX52_04485 [Burkholderiales bacterium]|nr:hypothetical protein [Burkholderiales bacterium]